MRRLIKLNDIGCDDLLAEKVVRVRGMNSCTGILAVKLERRLQDL